MGPTGELMEPHGMLTRMAAEDAFAEQAEALVRGGVDVLWIETIFAFDELAAATSAAAATGLPVASTMTFDTAGRTMMGDTPEKASEFIHRLSPPLIAYGANCGAGPAMLVETICSLGRSATRADVIIAKGNCGVPQTVNGEVVYSGDDETMARYARLVRDAGARIIGGCCGTTPERLRAIAHALDGYEPRGIPDRSLIESTLGATGVNGDKKRGRKRRPSRRHSSPGGAAPGRTRRSPDDE
jgi:5-methyltetrahydrofolate--homocysteine methyltransferase